MQPEEDNILSRSQMSIAANFAEQNKDLIAKSGKAAGKLVYDNREKIAQVAYDNREVIANTAYNNRE